MAAEPDSTNPPSPSQDRSQHPPPTRDPSPDLVHVADELHAIRRGLNGLAMAVDGLVDRREGDALGHLVHLVGRELDGLRGYVEEVRPRPASSA